MNEINLFKNLTNRPTPHIGAFIRSFNDEHREQFNPILFERNDYEVVEKVKNLFLSCNRNNKNFSILVESFELIEDYEDIIEVLKDREQDKIDNNKNNGVRQASSIKKRSVNQFDCISLKDTYFMLLVINMNISVKEDWVVTESMPYKMLIAIPRIVDKYYYKIQGNYYAPIFQIVDGSTYNNLTSVNAKTESVTFKTMFTPIPMYKNPNQVIDYNGNTVKYSLYNIFVFSKNTPAIMYLLAKFSLFEAIKFLELQYIDISQSPSLRDDYYVFEKHGIYINVPKVIFDNDVVTQNLVIVTYANINKFATIESIQTTEYWILMLTKLQFPNNNSIDKGISVMDSFENNTIDLNTLEVFRVPQEHKESMYHILRWQMREYDKLIQKDNIDLVSKRIRMAEYIPAMIAPKLINSINSITESKKKFKCKDIIKRIAMDPFKLTSIMIKSNKLLNFKNGVNDNDAFVALKCTYKGISGLGEQKGSSIPDIYRKVHHSQYGRIDLDASSATDPGITSIIAPMAKIYDGYFSDFEEPLTWEQEYDKVIDNYKRAVGKQELFRLRTDISTLLDIKELLPTEDEIMVAAEVKDGAQLLCRYFYEAEAGTEPMYYFDPTKLDLNGNMIMEGL